jgi:hypothetical protein
MTLGLLKGSERKRRFIIMSKEPTKAIAKIPETVDDNDFFPRIIAIIEKIKNLAVARISSEASMILWKIGHFINNTILYDNQAECGMWIFPILPGKSAGSDYV